LVKDLENYNQESGELNQGPGLLGSRNRRTTFSEQNGLPVLEMFEGRRKNVEVMSVYIVLYSKEMIPKYWTASLNV
jgi:hypothetical protein